LIIYEDGFSPILRCVLNVENQLKNTQVVTIWLVHNVSSNSVGFVWLTGLNTNCMEHITNAIITIRMVSRLMASRSRMI